MKNILLTGGAGFIGSHTVEEILTQLDGTKIKELGWEPKLNLHDSLEKTVKWTLDHKDWL